MEKKAELPISKIAALLLLLLFLAVEFKGLPHLENSDENVYFYMSRLVSEGNLPYKDFFYAHPPVELLIGAAIFKLFGFSLPMLKLVPLLAMAASGYLVYRISSAHFGELAGFLSSAFFLFSYRALFEATYFTGVALAVFFLLMGFWLMQRQPLLAGLFFSLAALTRLLSLIPIAVLLGFLLLKRFRSFAAAASAFTAVFLSANLLLSGLSPDYFVSVYKFHLLKPAVEGNTLQLFAEFAAQNWLLLAAASMAIVLWNRRLMVFAAAAGASLVFLLGLSRIFSFYFLIAMPFLAVMAGVAVDSSLKKLSWQKYALVAVLLVIAANAAFSVSHLWQFDFAQFKTGQEMADYVKANSKEGDLIFGDMTSAPLVALLSGRRIMADIADTNEMAYLSGVRDIKSELELAKRLKPRFFIVRPLYGIGSLQETGEFLTENCRLDKAYKDPLWADFLVFDCSTNRKA